MEDQGLGPRRGWAQSGLASTGSPGTGGRPAQSGTQSGDIEAKGLLEKMNGCNKTLTHIPQTVQNQQRKCHG